MYDPGQKRAKQNQKEGLNRQRNQETPVYKTQHIKIKTEQYEPYEKYRGDIM